jgi:hypothetical protein
MGFIFILALGNKRIPHILKQLEQSLSTKSILVIPGFNGGKNNLKDIVPDSGK